MRKTFVNTINTVCLNPDHDSEMYALSSNFLNKQECENLLTQSEKECILKKLETLQQLQDGGSDALRINAASADKDHVGALSKSISDILFNIKIGRAHV